MEQLDRKAMKKDFNRLGRALLVSQAAILAVSILGSYLTLGVLHIRNPLMSIQELSRLSYQYGYALIAAALAGLAPFFFLVRGEENRLSQVLDHGETPITPIRVLFYFLLILGVQVMLSIIMQPLITMLESTGMMNFSAANEVATDASITGSMLFYSIAVAPVCEELIYRGMVLRYLERYGRWFALIISAVVFALMHGNAVQMPVAFFSGLVFGYVTFGYSIELSILLHVMNNLFIEIIGRLSEFSPGFASMLDASALLAGLAVAILTMMSQGRVIMRFIRENKPQKGTFVNFFTSGTVVALCAYMVLMTVMSVMEI